MELFDTHAHLHDPWIGDDLPEVMDRAKQAGVEQIVTIGCSLEDSRNALAVAEQYDNVRATVGVHPHDAKDWTDEIAAEFLRMAASDQVVAIGEIGLDFYRNLSPHADQYRAFEAQLTLADQLNLPVVIHSRDAHEETYRILEDWAGQSNRPAPIGVIHCFSGDANLAHRYHDLGFLVSFAGPVTYPKNDALREAAKSLPLNAIVIETDAPYLSPQPQRGKRNEPANVRYTAQQLIDLRCESFDAVTRQTTANGLGLFRI
ncbi:MAG: TatD family deoxyribonuclease [Chloroflexi bacterium]|nr:TatD family deoxyribonuclease [Chloroflexota bacterium]